MNLYPLLIDTTRKLYLPKYVVSDRAPATLAEVVSHYTSTGTLVVWSGASKGTVWGPDSGNHLFRAWHDWVHVMVAGSFDRHGEALVCKVQQSQTESSFLQRALEIEIMGQLSHFEATGNFPIDQVKFFMQNIKKGA